MLRTLTVNAILEYIEENLETKPMDINNLVDYSGYSRRYLQQLFTKTMGIPVGRYILLRRITRAAILLRFTNLNIVDISERLFYDSQQTFTREFKKNSGYTPSQYRKSKVWIFKNMLGYREVNSNFPAPLIRHLEHRNIYGKKICYKEKIPSINNTQELKWNIVEAILCENNGQVYISHKPEADKTDKDNLFVNALIWNTQNNGIANEELAEGSYAYFSYKGTREGYRRLIYNAYMNTMPFYGLQKRDSYDLEIITKLDADNYYFEYFLPVENEQ